MPVGTISSRTAYTVRMRVSRMDFRALFTQCVSLSVRPLVMQVLIGAVNDPS